LHRPVRSSVLARGVRAPGAAALPGFAALGEASETATAGLCTTNPLEVILAETEQGRAILAVVDGGPPLGVETDEDVKARKELHRKIGYKL
jgi:uncharacterized protein